MLIIIFSAAGALVAAVAIAGFVCYKKLALPNMQPLCEQDLELCRDIVSRRQGYPWICRRTLKTGECACFPCEKLVAERKLALLR